MKCNNCGAEVPEGKTTCPNCAADPLAPKKEKQLGKYRESIKAFRRLCIFEWFNFLLTEGAYAWIFLRSGTAENEEMSIFENSTLFESSSVLPLIIAALVLAGWVAVMAYVYDEMKYYEESFRKIIGVRIRLVVMLFVLMLMLSISLWFMLFFVFWILIVQIIVGFAVSYHHIFWALSAYIKELSSDMAAQFDQLSAIYPALVVVAIPAPLFLALVCASLPEVGQALFILILTVLQALFLIVLPMFLLRCYRLCRSTRVSPERR